MEQVTFYVVRYEVKRERSRPGGTFMSTEYVYYKRHGQSTPHVHDAAKLTKDIAEQIQKFHADKNATIIEETHWLNPDVDVVHSDLDSLGEMLPNKALESALKLALRSMTKTEIRGIVTSTLKEADYEEVRTS